MYYDTKYSELERTRPNTKNREPVYIIQGNNGSPFPTAFPRPEAAIFKPSNV